jgi:hypothetical protein
VLYVPAPSTIMGVGDLIDGLAEIEFTVPVLRTPAAKPD